MEVSGVRVCASAVWVAGRWVESLAELSPRPGEESVRGTIPVEGLMGSERLPRADRVTQVGALAMARALVGLVRVEPAELSVLTASVLATSYTNERFERRRMEGKPPEPRSFPYTAPNAPAGEMAIAAAARGPTLALVGGAEVALVALARAGRWIAAGKCTRAVVVATECPPASPALLAPAGVVPMECAAAVVVERGEGLSLGWVEDPGPDALGHGPLLSVEALARVALAARESSAVRARGGAGVVVRVRAAAGAGLEARVG